VIICDAFLFCWHCWSDFVLNMLLLCCGAVIQLKLELELPLIEEDWEPLSTSQSSSTSQAQHMEQKYAQRAYADPKSPYYRQANHDPSSASQNRPSSFASASASHHSSHASASSSSSSSASSSTTTPNPRVQIQDESELAEHEQEQEQEYRQNQSRPDDERSTVSTQDGEPFQVLVTPPIHHTNDAESHNPQSEAPAPAPSPAEEEKQAESQSEEFEVVQASQSQDGQESVEE